MSTKEWIPQIPGLHTGDRHCVVCGEKVMAVKFVASKPRRGRGLIIAHTSCIKLNGGKETKA